MYCKIEGHGVRREMEGHGVRREMEGCGVRREMWEVLIVFGKQFSADEFYASLISIILFGSRKSFPN